MLFGLAHIRAPIEDLGRQPRRDARDRNRCHAFAASAEPLGRLADEDCQGRRVLQPNLFKRWDGRAHLFDQGFLLREVEVRGRTRAELLPDQKKNTAGVVKVAARDPQPILCGQDIEIGVGYGGECRERHDLAVETACDRGLDGGIHGRAVLAPEVDDIACRQGVVIEPAEGGAGAAASSSPASHRTAAELL